MKRILGLILVGLLIPSMAFAWGLMGFVGESIDVQYALDFDGNNDDVDLGTVIADGSRVSTLTISFVYEMPTVMTEARQIFSAEGGTDRLKQIFGTNDGVLNMDGFGYSGTSIAVDFFFQGDENEEHRLTLIYDKDASPVLKIYKDSSLQTLFTATDENPTLSLVGAHMGTFYSGAEYWDGLIKDVKIWNLAKSISDVVNGETTGLINHWDFSDGSGLTLTDIVGSNDGTITGATWVEL